MNGLLSVLFVVLTAEGPVPVFLVSTQDECEELMQWLIVDSACQPYQQEPDK